MLGSRTGTHTDQFNINLLRSIQTSGTMVIDPRGAFLDSTGRVYQVVRDGVVLYRDDSHLTTHGALKIISPIFEAQLDFSEPAHAPSDIALKP
jgi:hypothetical protein